MLRRGTIARGWLRTAVALAAGAAVGCVSTSDLARVEKKLEEVELHLLELKKDKAGKVEIDEIDAAIRRDFQQVLQAEADTRLALDELAQQIEQLESKLEETNFRLAQLAQQIAATNQELQAVRNTAEAQAPLPPPRTAHPSEPQAVYDTAYNDYLQGNFDLAILGFRQFLDTYSDTQLADNAAYWIGECLYRQGKYQQAIDQFDEVLSRYEKSDQIPSALLKKGYAYLELGQRSQGQLQLQTVICEYPGSDEARIARQRLSELGIDVEC